MHQQNVGKQSPRRFNVVEDVLKLEKTEDADRQRHHMQRPDPSPPGEIETWQIAQPRQSVRIHVGKNETREHEKKRDSTISKWTMKERHAQLAQHMVNKHTQRRHKPNPRQGVNVILRSGVHAEVSGPYSNGR